MEIHNYPNESLAFQDQDYYDIDFWTGTQFVTKKILGATIRAGIQSGVFILASNTTDDITEGATNKFNVTHTGEVTGSAALTISANAVTNAKLAQIPTATLKGRTTAGTGNVEDLTAAQATAIMNVFTDLLKGLVPASGGGVVNFLRADGSWAPPAGSGIIPQAQVFVETAIGSAVTTLAYTAIQNIILPTGTWLVEMSGETQHNSNNVSVFTAIGVAGVYENGTGRENKTVNGGSGYSSFATHKIITIVGLQTISLLAKVPSGTGIIRNRVITAIKLS